MNHEIPIADLRSARPTPEDLAHSPAQPVANHRRPDFAAGGNSKSGSLLIVGEEVEVARTTASAPTAPVAHEVLRALVQPVCGPQGLVHAERRLGCQALAAALAAAGEHGPAVLRAHPDQETMGALATAVVRLKRTLHGKPRIFVRILKLAGAQWRRTVNATKEMASASRVTALRERFACPLLRQASSSASYGPAPIRQSS